MPRVRLLGRLTPSFVPTARNPYGLFRSWRWRKAVKMSAYEGSPARWDIRCTSDCAAAYVCEVRHADGSLAFARRLALSAGENAFSFALSPVGDGALFRIFPASDADAGAELLIVSQFTLWADCRSRRPGFTAAARPETAVPLYERVIEACRARGFRVETGEFGADMQVASVNDGPVTIILDTREL